MPLTISHAKSDTIADFTGTVTVGNSSGGSTTQAATNLVRPSDWNSNHQYTMSVAASEMVGSMFSAGSGLSLTTNTNGFTWGLPPAMFYEPFPVGNVNTVADAASIGVWYFQPFNCNGLNSGRINLFQQRESSAFLNAVIAQSNSTGGFSATASFRNCLALYSQVTGSSNSLLTSIWTGEAAWSATVSRSWSGATSGMTVSNYLTVGFNSQFNSTGGVTSTTQTTSGTFSTGTTSMASTAPNSLITVVLGWSSGSCMDIVPFSTSIPAGNYWMANMFTTSSGGAGTTGQNFTSVGHTYFVASNSRLAGLNAQMSGYKRQGLSTTGNATSHGVPFNGSLLTTTSQASANVGTVNIQNFTRRMYFNYVQDTL